MAVAENAVLVLTSQEYVETPGLKRDIAPAVSRGFAAAGWALATARAAQLVVEFADGRGHAADGTDLPQIEGLPMTSRLPVAATARIPLQLLELQRGPAACSVEVADLGDPLARVWAAQVAPLETLTVLSDGQTGRADDKGMVVNMGRLLIRASMDDEGPGSSGARASAGRLLVALAAAV